MWILSLLLLTNVNYKVCDETRLVFENEEKEYQIDFFNVLFYDEQSRLKACEYLKESSLIELQEEPNAENAYYIYVNDQLFQTKLIENKWARVNVNFEEYLHDLKQKEVIVSADYDLPKRENASLWVLLGLFLLLCLCGFLAVWL